MASGKGVNEVRMRVNKNVHCVSCIKLVKMVLSFKKVCKED